MIGKRKLLAIALCVVMVFSCVGGMTFGDVNAETENSYETMDDLVKILGGDNSQNLEIDGERAFDYLSYVYMGWRNTGGDFQNNVIDEFIIDQLTTGAGYTYLGAGKTGDFKSNANTVPSKVDGSDRDGDNAWITYYGSSSNVWDPKYASLKIVSDNSAIDPGNALKERIEVEAFGFDPTSQMYLKHYNDEYGGIDEPLDMWDWITAKDGSGNRTNVDNGKEAELNLRTHLARNSSFTTTTDAAATIDDPDEVKGITGEAIYVGTISGSSGRYTTSKYPTVAETNAACEGKVILSDSSLTNTTRLAAQAGGVGSMSTNSLSGYSTPKDADGNIEPPFEKSARYAGGAGQTKNKDGIPIVEWQFSTDQKTALKDLLEKAANADEEVVIENKALGNYYPMNSAKGQAVAISEIKGASKPDERILICAHVQEPGSNDNATGVGAQLEIATKFKQMIDTGAIDRPERTITFLWGDEMNLATLWMKDHPNEAKNLVSVLDMDMVGEDPDKTGGVMRIEKTPDPSAQYNYTLDELSWVTNPREEGGPYYDRNTFAGLTDGKFVRLPDSHTLWGAGSTNGLFKEGFFLNDLYMSAAQSVINNHDSSFKVDVCPYEGGSDHSRFLAAGIPALLTWHFTDFTYHTSVDTLAMSSAVEMENVDITTIASALQIANATEKNRGYCEDLLSMVSDAAAKRFAVEKQNTTNLRTYLDATNASASAIEANYELEEEVLTAWHDWYAEALDSVSSWLLGEEWYRFTALKNSYDKELATQLNNALTYAKEKIVPQVSINLDNAGGEGATSFSVFRNGPIGKLPVPTKTDFNLAGWFTDNTYTTQVTEDTIVTADMSIVAKWVDKDDIAGLTANKISDLTYNGKVRTPLVQNVKLNNKVLTKDKDYTVEYKNNKDVGKATIVLTGAGEYKGVKEINFNINPKNASKIKYKAGKKKIKVSWKKATGVSKYQVRYKASKSKKWIVKNVSPKKASYTIKKLKKGKKYKIQVRTYKKVGKTNYYSNWSKVKTVKSK